MLANYQTKNYSPSSIQKAKAELELRRRRRERDELLEQKRKVWRARPDLYAFERLGITLTASQIEILFSVRDNRRTAVKAHHALGKTFVAAIALLWWIDCQNRNIGYITAPTWGQALRLTFKQAKRLAIINKLDFEILDTGIIRDRDSFKATERFIQALNADSGEGFQGEHTAPILIVKDESTGVKQHIHEASEGLMTSSDCRMLEIANPTDEATEFGESCESPSYNTLSYSALEHENILAELQTKPAPFKGAISLLWLFEQMTDECEVVDSAGESCFEFYSLETIQNALEGIPAPPIIRDENGKINHELSNWNWYKPTAFFEGRVLGEFPTEASSKVIPKGWLNALPVFEISCGGKIQLGCDTARFGDDRTTIFARIGKVVISARIIRKFDNIAVTNAIKEVAAEVIQFLAKLGIVATKKDIAINIDTTGGLGTAPYDYLKADGYNVNAINSSETANNADKYVNVRSELWFDVRDRFKDKEIDYSRLPLEIKRVLTKELATPLYKINSKGKKVVEEKADIKKRLGASPDVADGFNLCFYESSKKVIYQDSNYYSQSSY